MNFQNNTLGGNLGSNPETKPLPQGKKIYLFSFAVNEGEEVTWFPARVASVSEEQTRFFDENLVKGSAIIIRGAFKSRKSKKGTFLQLHGSILDCQKPAKEAGQEGRECVPSDSIEEPPEEPSVVKKLTPEPEPKPEPIAQPKPKAKPTPQIDESLEKDDPFMAAFQS